MNGNYLSLHYAFLSLKNKRNITGRLERVKKFLFFNSTFYFQLKNCWFFFWGAWDGKFVFSKKVYLDWLPHLEPVLQTSSILRQNHHLDWLKGLGFLAPCCRAEDRSSLTSWLWYPSLDAAPRICTPVVPSLFPRSSRVGTWKRRRTETVPQWESGTSQKTTRLNVLVISDHFLWTLLPILSFWKLQHSFWNWIKYFCKFTTSQRLGLLTFSYFQSLYLDLLIHVLMLGYFEQVAVLICCS